MHLRVGWFLRVEIKHITGSRTPDVRGQYNAHASGTAAEAVGGSAAQALDSGPLDEKA